MGKDNISSFTQMGEKLGHIPSSHSSVEKTSFFQLSVLEQLRACARSEKHRPQSVIRERKACAINSASVLSHIQRQQ